MLLVLTIIKFLILAVFTVVMVRIYLATSKSLSGIFSFVRRRETAVVLWIFLFGFISLLAYQSYWQIFIHNDYFTETKNLHDPRPWIIEATTMKGNIYDRHQVDSLLLAGYAQSDEASLPRRFYPLGEATSHLIGYSDVERGKAGIEKSSFARLMGWTHYDATEKNNYLNNKYFRIKPIGNDITLTIDYELQKCAYNAFGSNKGAVVAIQPATGDVLILVSAPSYHPDSVAIDQAWARIVKDADNQRLYNRALWGLYAPGSTMKTIVASAAIEKGLDPVWEIGADGYLPPGVRRKRVYDHERASYQKRGGVWRGHGKLDLTQALVKSSNAFYAKLGVTVGDSLMHDMAFRFGFNQPVAWNISHKELLKGINVFQSSFPATENEHELAWSCIGQERVLTTPFQLALVTCAIANNGILMKPKLEFDEKPQVWRQVMSEHVARKVQKMMREVVWGKGGTAYRMQMKEVEVAGKTGTSEITKIIKKDDGTTEKIIINNALFISFAPVDNPQIAIAVVAEGAGYGGAAAAPVAKEIYLKAFQLGYFKNDSSKNINIKN